LSYSPFDVVRYKSQNEKVVQLTRRELPYIRATRKNPWTMEPIPDEVITELEHRQRMADRWDLPKECLPLNQVIDTLFPRLRLED
jgi:hypothetical protein